MKLPMSKIKYGLLPISIIFLVWFVFASPFFLKGLVPFPSRYQVTFFQPWQPYYGMPNKNNAMPDIITQIYPWRYQSIQSWKEGGFGLWNPYSFSGTVHAANYQSAPYFPLNILFFLFPFIDAWSLLVLLQPLVAGLGMYALLRSLGRTSWAAVFGSIAFMFCGFMTGWMAYGTLAWAVAFLPIILLGINKIQHYNHSTIQPYHHSLSWFSGCFISLGIGFSLLAGHFQMSVYVLLVALGYAAYVGKPVFVRSLVFIMLGLLFALPQIAPAIEAFTRSARSENFILSAGIPLHYLITLFAPDFYGNPVTRNDWFGQYAEWASYIGVLPLLFSVIGVLYTQKTHRFFILVALMSILLALASPLSSLFYQLQIPVLSTSVATRMIILFSFSLIVLAAAGFDAFFDKNVKIIFKIRHILFLILCLAFMWLLPYLLTNNTIEYRSIAQRNLILPTLLFVSGVGIMFLQRIKKLRTGLIIAALLVTSIDMYRYSSKWMPFEEREFVFPTVPIIEFLQKHTGQERVFSNAGNEMNTYFQIPSLEGYDAMYNARYGEFISAASDGTIKPLQRSVVNIDRSGAYTKRWFDILGVRYIVHRLSDGRNVWVFPHWEYSSFRSVYKDDHYEVFENQEALQKNYLVGLAETQTTNQDMIDRLTDSAFPISSKAIVEKDLSTKIASGSGIVTMTSAKSSEVIVQTETTTPQLFIRTVAYDPGWQVYVNGVKQELLRVNYAFQGVVVPKGKATVRFVYLPLSFQLGLLGFGISVFVLGVGSVRQLLHDRWVL